jgi:hypothetical protein
MSPAFLRPLVGLVLMGLLATGCEPPPVVPTADRRQNQQLSRIEGSVVVQSKARGNVIVLLYDAARPPPPQGSGRPVSFTVVPAEQLFGMALGDGGASSGPFTAPFAFSLVAPGKYLLRGFVDANTCLTRPQPCHVPDFIPWYGVTGEPNSGDVGGAAVDASTGQHRVVEVATGPDGVPQAVTGVTVTFSDAVSVPHDRPAFYVPGQTQVQLTSAAARQIELRPLSLQEGTVDVRPSGFLVRYMDEDGNREPDDANGDGVPEFWPRVVVRKLASSGGGLVDENDLDRNGVLDAEGADYPRLDGTSDGLPDLVVLAAGFHPDGPLTALRAAEMAGRPRMDPVLVTKLDLVVRPQAVDARDPRQPPIPLKSLPSGRYAIILLQFTGQTWRIPNELSPPLAASLGLPEVESQSFIIEVP